MQTWCTSLKPLIKHYDNAHESLETLRAQWKQLGPTLLDMPSPLCSDGDTPPQCSEASGSPRGEEEQDALRSGVTTGGEAGPGVKRSFAHAKRRRRLTQGLFLLRHSLLATQPVAQATSVV